METTINKELYKVLKGFDNRYFLDEELNKNKVIQDLEDYNPKLLQALLSNDLLKKYFTMNIEGHTILQTSKLIELFELNDYWKSSYTRYSKKIGLTTNGKFIDESTDVVLDFPYKDTVLKASMSKEDTDQNDLRPDEPFLNEVIAKEEIDQLLGEKIFSNVKRYSNSGNHVVDRFDKKDNLIIKGNNLLAMYSLKKKYGRRFKLIYLDPPYFFKNSRTDESFMYNSTFKLSTWLTFMKNRLEVTFDLLADDSFIAIQMNDDGVSHLKILCDSIFGESNFLNQISVKMAEPTGVKMKHVNKRLPRLKEHILFYRKGNPELTPVKKPKGKWDSEYNTFMLNFSKEDYDTLLKVEESKDLKKADDLLKKVVFISLDKIYMRLNIPKEKQEDFNRKNAYRIVRIASMTGGAKSIADKKSILLPKDTPAFSILSPRKEVYFIRNGYNYSRNSPRIKLLFAEKYLSVNVGDFWDDIKTTGLDNEGVYEFLNGKKPEKLLQRIISLTTKPGDMVLDFFLGSGTTAAVAHKMGRQYIGIEQMDYINTVTVPRLQKVIEGEQGGISKDVDWQGGGNFVYAELMEKNRGFIKMIQEAEDPLALQKIFDFMLEEAEIDFRVDLEEVKDTLHELSFEDQKKILFAIIDKNQLYYSYSEIDDENVRDLIADEDYTFNKSFYEDGGE